MATLRRSLIQMDFLVRKKKKKDKRRNTVADIESSALKNITEPIDNSKQRLSVPCTPSEPEYLQDNVNIPMSKSDIIITEAKTVPSIGYSSSEENNNTKSFSDSSDTLTSKKTEVNSKSSNEKLPISFKSIHKDSFIKSKFRRDDANETSKQPAEWAKRIKESVENKKKARTNIPISTISAAMTVAVKMRQTSGITQSDDNQSSSGNWSGSSSSGRASSDSDDIKAYLKDKVSSSRDSLLSESTPTHDAKEPQDSCENTTENEQKEYPNPVVNTGHKSLREGTKNFNLVKSKSYSFDSDDDLSTTSYVGYHQYASSTSISTGSNESLNSLLSRTATELSGSTETLTSISKLPLPPPPPPPPPPRISSVKPNHVVKFEKHGDIYSRTYPANRKPRKKENQVLDKKFTQDKMYIKGRDHKKLSSNDSKSTKVTFSSILQKKFKSKDNEKLKPYSSKISKLPNNSCIDMYGGQLNSNQKVSILVNGNKMSSPEKPKVRMHSFLPKHAILKDPYQSNNFSDVNETPSICSSSCASSRTECISPTNSDMFSDSAIESSEETNVPLKYAPQITVMPVRRSSSSYQTSLSPCSCNSNSCYTFPQITANNTSNYDYANNRDEQCYQKKFQYLTINSPSQISSSYNLPRNNAAHVMLDTNGHVLHSTNSLDRRLYNKVSQVPYPKSSSMNGDMNYQERNYTDQRFVNRNFSFTSPSLQHYSPSPVPYVEDQFSRIAVPQHEDQFTRTSTPQHEINLSCRNTDINTSYVIPNGISANPQNRNLDIQRNSVYYGSLPSRGKSNWANSHEKTYHSHDVFKDLKSNTQTPVSSTYSTSYPISTSNQSLLTKENVQQHLRNTNNSHKLITKSVSNPVSNSYRDKKVQPNENKSDNDLFQSTTPVKSMTAEDLFAIIHDSKKRLNIKTESDLSPTPSSSRSSSPSFLRQIPLSKNGLAETGFLSPRSPYPLSSRDRRSWADFRPASERKSLASDRMGPNKPTSLHEFKMLLLQTRSNTRHNQRQSAVEQLKATSPNRSMDIAENLSLNSPLPSPLSPLQTPSSYGIYDGHLTVPLKRSHRSKGALQPRYIMYPPIMEDCSEEVENCSESLPNNQLKGFTSKTENCTDESWQTDNRIMSDKDNTKSQTSKVRFANSSMWV